MAESADDAASEALRHEVLERHVINGTPGAPWAESRIRIEVERDVWETVMVDETMISMRGIEGSVWWMRQRLTRGRVR